MGLLEWQNLIFVLPMATAILYGVLMTFGISMGEHGDLDLGHDVDIDHDLDVGGHDMDAGHDFHGDAHAVDAAGAVGHHAHWFGAAMGLLGVGKVPLSVLMLTACFVWGVTGLVLNMVLGTESMLKVAGFTALAAAVGTRLVAEGLSAVLPREESYHTPKEELVGDVGQVLYEVTPASGTVRLRDPSGNLLDLDCRSCGEDQFKAGTQVVLQEYDRAADVFYVRGEM